MKINGINDSVDKLGNAQSTAIQSLTSPAPIQPFDQAETSTKQANHKSREPGNFARSPATRSGSEYQLGIRLVRRSYRLMAKI